MRHDQLVAEVLVYARKICVIKDWFEFVYARGYLQLDQELRDELMRNEVVVPTSRVINSMEKEALIRSADSLSLYAAHLETCVHKVFRANKCRGIMRFGILSMLEKLEAGIVPHNWRTPFTAGLEGIDALFEKPERQEGDDNNE